MKKSELKDLLRDLPLIQPSSELDGRVEQLIRATDFEPEKFRDRFFTFSWQKLIYSAMGVAACVLLVFLAVQTEAPETVQTTQIQLSPVESRVFDCASYESDLFLSQKKSIISLKNNSSSEPRTEE